MEHQQTTTQRKYRVGRSKKVSTERGGRPRGDMSPTVGAFSWCRH